MEIAHGPGAGPLTELPLLRPFQAQGSLPELSPLCPGGSHSKLLGAAPYLDGEGLVCDNASEEKWGLSEKIHSVPSSGSLWILIRVTRPCWAGSTGTDSMSAQQWAVQAPAPSRDHNPLPKLKVSQNGCQTPAGF